MATEHEAELRMETEMEQVGAKAEGRIRQERMNHDLILEKARADAVEKRDTVLRAIKDGGKYWVRGWRVIWTAGTSSGTRRCC